MTLKLTLAVLLLSLILTAVLSDGKQLVDLEIIRLDGDIIATASFRNDDHTLEQLQIVFSDGRIYLTSSISMTEGMEGNND
jgi:hypothetical protein